ncbi:FtsX-like permease family protein [Georgenia sp. TF02-10]|uniref:ABC transporter permease n=1 Tax=Georgenia sp. TF02-10 TaxID=2917725 RepID=UPI001FA76993|nr:FtsX-like permease family protein [Georgenia sp. TF02-10]UNX53767.1 FtsX-like permease family protein [Georgenia sp. TF02-10]
MPGANGGTAARRAVLRWARRSFRREWRQQLLVLSLLTVSVAAATGFSTAAYNTVGVPEDAVFGSANHRYTIEDARLAALRDDVEAAGERFGGVDVIGEWRAPVPGSVESVVYRAQDPRGPFSGPMLARLEGRYPTAAGEVAVTDGVAGTLQAGIGDRVDLDGRPRTVVGIVENPSDLDEEFALVSAAETTRAETLTLLIGGTGAFDEVRAIREFGGARFPSADLTSRGDAGRVETAAAVVGVGGIVLVLVSLVASAGFVAVAQRRLRQLGMLSAVGATQRHLRLVVIANGALVGVVAATLGAVLGLGGWFLAAPVMEPAVGYRIDRWNVPWPLAAATVAAALVMTTAAAWWPARAVSMAPTTDALSGRPGAPRPARRSAAVGAALAAVGLALLLVPGDNVVIVAVGTVAAVAGVLSLAPVAVEALGLAARGLPVAVRLAWRDLSRHRARSALALAAVSLALGIPVAVLVGASAADATAPPGNLPEDRLLVWTRDPAQPEGESPFYTVDPDDDGFAPYLPDLSTADLDRAREALAARAAEQGWVVVDLDVAVDPRAQDDPIGPTAVTVARRTDLGYLDVALVYRATPELLDLYGLDRLDGVATTAPTGPTDIVTDTHQLWLANLGGPPAPLDDAVTLDPTYGSLPGTLVGAEELDRRGWTTRTVGWLLVAPAAVTDAQVAAIREVAADNGLLVEDREERSSLVALRWGATTVGVAVALAVLSMIVGLMRVEAARDTRILTATGATSTVRRALTASTAGGLAGLGALVGALGAYLVLATGYVDPRGLAAVPVLPLSLVILGVPLLACAAGWISGGRAPTDLGRQPIE